MKLLLILALLFSLHAQASCSVDLQLCQDALAATEASRAEFEKRYADAIALGRLYKEQRDDAQEQAIKAAGRSTFLGIGSKELAIGLLGVLAGVLVSR